MIKRINKSIEKEYLSLYTYWESLIPDYEEYFMTIRKFIRDIEKQYSKHNIRKYTNIYNSLVYMRGIWEHSCSTPGDMDDCYWHAANIVLLKHHAFDTYDEWSSDSWTTGRLKTYRLMKRMGIPLDKKMRRDFHKRLHRLEKLMIKEDIEMCYAESLLWCPKI